MMARLVLNKSAVYSSNRNKRILMKVSLYRLQHNNPVGTDWQGWLHLKGCGQPLNRNLQLCGNNL